MIALTLPYPPSTNRLWRNFRGRAVLSEEGRIYKSAAALLASQVCDKPLQGDIRITVKVYRPRKSGDIDNRLKACLDALQGTVYENDSQIIEIHAYRFDDKKNPRIEVEVGAIS